MLMPPAGRNFALTNAIPLAADFDLPKLWQRAGANIRRGSSAACPVYWALESAAETRLKVRIVELVRSWPPVAAT